MNKFNVIFPMAGEGSRFNYQFKPFLNISDQTFIELAYKYFKMYDTQINNLIFIITKKQAENKIYNIEYRLKEIFGNDIKLIIIKEKTKGPYQTIKNALGIIKIEGPSFICDCDHSINISPIINQLSNLKNYDVILSTWNISEENINSWSKVYYNEKNEIVGFSEKELLDIGKKYYGIIGCTYIKDLSFFNNENYINISEGLEKVKNIKGIKIEQAEFFGDPERLKKTIDNRRKKETIFCDLDGTLIYHEANPDYNNTKILEGTLEKINYWKNNNYYIILTTARNNKKKLINTLKKNGIYYDEILTGVPSGPRHLINDVKPIYELKPQAYSYNIIRNKGIKNINFESVYYEIKNIFKGNSFSKTILIFENNKYKVRKYIIKNKGSHRHYLKLKRQLDDIKRFNYYFPNICPEILLEYENDYLYYFDIQYLKNYKTLNLIENNEKIIDNITKILNKNIYCIRKKNEDDNWIKKYLEKKIKIEEYKKIDPVINKLLNITNITINGINLLGIPNIIKKNFNYLKPKYLSPIHGDLTFENILVDKNNNIKLIDMDGSEYVDAQELDFGKLLQSFLLKYEFWGNNDELVKIIDLDNNIIDIKEFINNEKVDELLLNFNYWKEIFEIEDNKILKEKGIFFMCSHLFRMIPYQYKISLNNSIFCICQIIIWMNKIL